MFSTVMYKGINSPLSNLFRSELVYFDITFPSSEHAYEYLKLDHHKHPRKDELKEIDCPILARKFASACLPCVDESWLNCRRSVMKDVLKIKFLTCPQYRERISNIDEFIEDSSDTYWGRGLNNNGTNMMGKLHREIKQGCTKVLIAGSSHVRRMNEILPEMAIKYGKLVATDVVCLPGGTTVQLEEQLKKYNLDNYDMIIIVIGSNDLYTKVGILQMSGEELLAIMNGFMSNLARVTRCNVILNPILPRTTNKRESSLPLSYFVKQNRKLIFINRHLLFCRAQSEFWNGDEANAKYLLPDGIHLNMLGKKLLAEYWLEDMV